MIQLDDYWDLVRNFMVIHRDLTKKSDDVNSD